MDGRFDRFTLLIADIYQNIQKIKAAEMEAYGLRTGHVDCLHRLYQHPEGLTSGELTALCDLDKAAVSRYCAALSEKGLIRMEDHPERTYRRKWFLTKAGEETAAAISVRIAKAVEAGGAFLAQDEREMLYRNLETISSNLRQWRKELSAGPQDDTSVQQKKGSTTQHPKGTGLESGIRPASIV